MNALAHHGLIPSPPGTRDLERAAYGFAHASLKEQRGSSLGVQSAARALAFLLARSVERPNEPVVLSALEGARVCGFEPRTWWHVKRRLLQLGHLVASTGGGPPPGRPGGRGHKGAYFVAPTTLARFTAFLADEKTLKTPGETLKTHGKTLKVRPETLKTSSQDRALSHHRLRLLKKKGTSDVPSPVQDDERPTASSLWARARAEPNARVKLGLLRLLETVLLSEVLERVMGARTVENARETENAPSQNVKDTPSQVRERRWPRAGTPLWSPVSTEEQAVFVQVREILAWANQAFGARFDLERSSKDALLYPFERVRGAVANVLLKKARSYRFGNPGAVLWDGITLEGYKLEEFSVGPFAEVLERIGKKPLTTLGLPRAAVKPLPSSQASHELERRRGLLLQAVYDKLPDDARKALDERALVLARNELGGASSSLRLGLLRLEKRNELLLAEHGDANGQRRSGDESQIPRFASDRNETEPIGHVNRRT